ncbi:MAG TPA: pilus assembly protein CpaE, partial [Sphingomicrobium sp.]|nr:pilus assembly protein CpaE [Sphingomicrobium sp.]
EAPLRLYLTNAEGDTSDLVGVRAAGLPLELNIVPVTDWIDPDELNGAAAAVIQVDETTPASLKRFQKLARSTDRPLIAAAYDPPLSLVRSLLRDGAADVLPLPLDLADLETALQQVHKASAAAAVHEGAPPTDKSKVVSILKSAGGVGATSLVAQLAARFAAKESNRGREACLLDLDVQFGDAAFQLGLHPTLSVADLLDASSRLDGSLVRATTARHSSGLNVIAAPRDLMPVEGHSADDFIRIVDVAAHEFGTVFVELPTNWTNWSLSLLARSDLVLVVAELTVTSINRARRQIELLRSEGLGELEYRIVINRFDKGQLRTIRLSDVSDALGYPITQTVSNDPATMRTASDRGVTIDEVKRKSAVGKDIDSLDAAIAAALGLEH